MTKNKQPITSIIQKVSNLCGMVIAVAVFVTTVITTTAPTVFAASTYEYTTPGTFNLTLPEGTTSITVTSVGGGGGAAFLTNPDFLHSYGGGGGEIVKNVTINISSDKDITIVVGTGGENELWPNQASGFSGGDSYITYMGTTYALAHGGGGGSIIGAEGIGTPGKAGGPGGTDGGGYEDNNYTYGLPGTSYSDTIGRGGYAGKTQSGETLDDDGKPGAIFISMSL